MRYHCTIVFVTRVDHLERSSFTGETYAASRDFFYYKYDDCLIYDYFLFWIFIMFTITYSIINNHFQTNISQIVFLLTVLLLSDVVAVSDTYRDNISDGYSILDEIPTTLAFSFVNCQIDVFTSNIMVLHYKMSQTVKINVNRYTNIYLVNNWTSTPPYGLKLVFYWRMYRAFKIFQ